jgi:KDO2-lipid IV(A) lauroyltransferase
LFTRVGQWFAYVGVRLSLCLAQALPLEFCIRAADWLATICTTIVHIRRGVVDDNLRHAFPKWSPAQRKEVTWQMWRHLFLILVEFAHAPRRIHETNWRRYISMHRGDELCRILLERRPVLIVSGHFGNFELGGVFLGLLGFPTYGIARTLDNPYLAKWVTDRRNAGLQAAIPKKGGYEQILAALDARGTIAFLADQYAGSKGCWVNFFGRPASAHKAISLFSLDSGARMVICSCRRVGGQAMRFEMSMDAVYDPRSGEYAGDLKGLTQWYTTQLEHVVRDAPEQYWWVHRRWKDTRKKRREARAAKNV